MARKGHSPPAPPLPKAQYTKVDGDSSTQPAGVHDLQARSYGYNDFSNFQRPDHYIRYIEPLESELAVQVEYDMDEQDQEWLDAVNAERKHDQLNKVSYEVFEIIMDRLEKEWFDLTKNLPKPDFAMPSEDSTCAICDDAEGENANAIVFCDGCNLAVHQDCYGVPYIPEGQWLCRKCTVSPEVPVTCMLCPSEGGAFKQTVHGEWVHLLCAIWVPETRVANDVFMEPVTGVEKINKQRWKLKCSICDVKKGACIQCSKASCFLAFHTTCARKEKLLMPMKSAHGSEPATLACYCERHLPKDQLAAHEVAMEEMAAVDIGNASFETSDSHVNNGSGRRASKKARAYAKSYSTSSSPPLIPAIIVGHILTYIGKVSVRKKPEFVHLVCRYWSLKREARRGAPLLKRLHLEPWSGASGRGTAGRMGGEHVDIDEFNAQKLEYLVTLRTDLERVRLLAELTRKREEHKLERTEVLQDLMNAFFFPHTPNLRLALENIEMMDRHEIFKNPVSKAEAPDYAEVIKKPMCWRYIDEKLDKNEYANLKDFQDDVLLVFDNAMTYNARDSPIYRTATRMKASSARILSELDQTCQLNGHAEPPSDAVSSSLTPLGSPAVEQPRLVGDLEPPLCLLDLLLTNSTIQEDCDYVLDSHPDPLSALFAYELGILKPEPTPPPPPPPKPRKKKAAPPKRDRKAEKERRMAQLEAQKILDNAPGFRAPGTLTRSARAAVDAFEAEANAGGADDDGADEVSEASTRHRWRRNVVLPGRADVPPVVDDVDNQRSFKMFDEGWILPANQRRGGRAPVERLERPPPRKKARVGEKERQLSTLSLYSTAASENRTLPENVPLPPSTSSVSQFDVQAKEEQQGDDAMLGLSDQAGPSALPIETSSSMDAIEEQLVEQAVDEETPVIETKPTSARKRKGRTPPIIIEKLDTPATRRAETLARKQKKLEALAEALRQAQFSMAPPPPPVTGSSSGYTLDSMAGDLSDLSSLSSNGSDAEDEDEDELEKLQPQPLVAEEVVPLMGEDEGNDDGIALDEDAEGEDDDAKDGDIVVGHRDDEEEDAKNATEQKPEAMTTRGWKRVSAENALALGVAMKKGPGEIHLHDNEFLEGGTLVWAKVETFPWWPAVVFEEDDDGVPPNVLDIKHDEAPFVLVQFWDNKRQWLWAPLDRVKLLGEVKELDAVMLSGAGRGGQRFKNQKLRDQCRSAFRTAMAEMEGFTAEEDGG